MFCFMHYVLKNDLFLAWLPGISAISSENCRHYNLQATANISGKFTTLDTADTSDTAVGHSETGLSQQNDGY